jgi:hypothetical protein
VLTVNAPLVETFRLPAYIVVMLFVVPESVSEPPFSEPLTVVAPKTDTVPCVRSVTLKLPANVETPEPAKVLIATFPVPLVKVSVPRFVTVPNEPAETVNKSLLKVAVPLEAIVNPLPPDNSVPTVKEPEPTFKVPL